MSAKENSRVREGGVSLGTVYNGRGREEGRRVPQGTAGGVCAGAQRIRFGRDWGALSSAGLLVTFLSLTAARCVSGSDSHRAFTDDWQYRQQRAAEVKRRDELMKDELVLVGEEGGARAAVELDEKGRPTLNVGKKRGFSADIDIDKDEADVTFKYELEWGRKKGAAGLGETAP